MIICGLRTCGVGRRRSRDWDGCSVRVSSGGTDTDGGTIFRYYFRYDICLPVVFFRENLFNTSETRTLPTEYHPSFFIPAKTQRFTHSQENNISTFRRENTNKKIPKKLKISLKISET